MHCPFFPSSLISEEREEKRWTPFPTGRLRLLFFHYSVRLDVRFFARRSKREASPFFSFQNRRTPYGLPQEEEQDFPLENPTTAPDYGKMDGPPPSLSRENPRPVKDVGKNPPPPLFSSPPIPIRKQRITFFPPPPRRRTPPPLSLNPSRKDKNPPPHLHPRPDRIRQRPFPPFFFPP